jgi:hypothetical protein
MADISCYDYNMKLKNLLQRFRAVPATLPPPEVLAQEVEAPRIQQREVKPLVGYMRDEWGKPFGVMMAMQIGSTVFGGASRISPVDKWDAARGKEIAAARLFLRAKGERRGPEFDLDVRNAQLNDFERRCRRYFKGARYFDVGNVFAAYLPPEELPSNRLPAYDAV